jgi:uncharacterized membrane protein
MIVMVLDHVRDFYHAGAMTFQADDLTRTSAVLFFTRWITHICAPVFMFTAGLAAYFWWWDRGRTKGQLSRFLWTRGLWLVFLELTAVRVAFTFGSGPLILNVLWALGWSMVVLALLVHLPVRVLAVLSVAVMALHNLADPFTVAPMSPRSSIWMMVHQPGVVNFGGFMVVVAYPLVPWFAVMAAGFCFGSVFGLDRSRRRRWLVRIGVGLILGFLVIRGINLYGDPQPWSSRIPGMTLLSFLRCTKYPPSLDFLMMTLGPAMLLLAWFERFRFSSGHPLIVFGRVPLFFFLVHLFVIHLAAFPLAIIRYGHAAFLLNPLPSLGGPANLYPPGYGYSLTFVYGLWIAIVVLLYPLCRWFAKLKARRRDWWLSYL